jgi:hypothetical protein
MRIAAPAAVAEKGTAHYCSATIAAMVPAAKMSQSPTVLKLLLVNSPARQGAFATQSA